MVSLRCPTHIEICSIAMPHTERTQRMERRGAAGDVREQQS